jgi:hypothetical protein
MWQGQELSRGRLVQGVTCTNGLSLETAPFAFHPHAAELAIFNIQIISSLLPFTSPSLLNFVPLYAH